MSATEDSSLGSENAALRAEIALLKQQVAGYEASVRAAHLALDESGVVSPRDVSHQGLSARIGKVLSQLRREKESGTLRHAINPPEIETSGLDSASQRQSRFPAVMLGPDHLH